MKEALTYDDIQIVPKYSEISSRSDCDISTRFTRNFYAQTPYVSSPMDTVTGKQMAESMMYLDGIGCIHRFMSIEEQVDAVKNLLFEIQESMIEEIDKKQRAICASIGVKDYKERLEKLVENGANVILIDVAHGNTKLVKDTIKYIKENYKVDVIAGNVATYEGAKNLCEWGSDAVRVGIGSGSLCTTRIKTGIGIPQVTAILDCVEACKEYDVPVIADGGVRMIGDAAKALALGAETVMLGSLLAGTKESPGIIEKIGEWPNEKLYKKYRGSSSLESKIDNNIETRNIEGDSTRVMYTGGIERILNDMSDGIRSSMSYVGANNIKEFQSKCEFVRITQSGIIEAKPHLLKI
jgi:IMP dehydrogenase